MITFKLIPVLLVSGMVYAQTPVFPNAVVTDSQLKVGVNTCQTTLANVIQATDLTMTLVNATNCIVPNMLMTIDREIVSITSVNPIVMVRGFDGTTPAIHAQYSVVSAFHAAWNTNAPNAEIKAIEQTLGANLANIPAAQNGYILDSNNYPSLLSACSTAGSTKSLYVTLVWTGLTTASYPCTMTFLKGSIISPASGQTITLNNVSCPPTQQCFDTSLGGTITFSNPQVGLTPFNWGAKGDGVTDDSVALSSLVAYYCTVANSGSVIGAKVSIPNPINGFLVTATIPLCSYLEIEGYQSKIIYHGTSTLFSIPQAYSTIIHGLIFYGNNTANTWAINIIGTGGVGLLNGHFYDNRCYFFGDVATASGGCIENQADSGKLVIDGNFLQPNGTGFLTTGPTDSLNLHDNYFACLGSGRGMDFSGEIGVAEISITHNNNVCNGGALRVVGPGAYYIAGNEYEATSTITNASSAAFEYLPGTSPPIIYSLGNYAAIHQYGTYGFYVSSSGNGPVYSVFIGDSMRGNYFSGGTDNQYTYYNNNSSLTNRYLYGIRYEVNGNIYTQPSSPEVTAWPISSGNLTDAANILRGTSNSVTVNSTVSAVFWSAGIADYTVVNHGLTNGQLINISNIIPAAWNVTECIVTVVNASHITCPLAGLAAGNSPPNWVSGGTVTAVNYTILATQDLQVNPLGVGSTGLKLNRIGNGTGNGILWALEVQDSLAIDTSRLLETSSNYTSGSPLFGWIGNTMTGLYFPQHFRLGTGTSTVPVLQSDGVGNIVIPALPSSASTGGLYVCSDSNGTLYRKATCP